jgi:hypothetical protein
MPHSLWLSISFSKLSIDFARLTDLDLREMKFPALSNKHRRPSEEEQETISGR